jgi:CheY-like chemotaxis protein
MFKADPEKFALVVTDYTMPGMNGLVLAERLREIRPGLPIILMTGNNLSLTHEKLLRAGIAEMLLKPSTLTALGKAVQRALSFAVANA